MENGTASTPKRIFRLLVFVTCLAFLFSLFLARGTTAKTAKEINSEVNEALKLFSKHVQGAKQFIGTAKAVVVIPNIVKAGLGVGGEYGEGRFKGWRKDSGLLQPCCGFGRTSDRGAEDQFGPHLQARRGTQEIPNQLRLEGGGGWVGCLRQ